MAPEKAKFCMIAMFFLNADVFFRVVLSTVTQTFGNLLVIGEIQSDLGELVDWLFC